MNTISTWRRRWRRPKRAIARGIAVFGNPGFDAPDNLKELLSHHDEVRKWAAERELALSDRPEGLSTLDDVLSVWNADPTIGHKLSNEVGMYLGRVLVENVVGSHWIVWPNGHPVVRLSSGRELDVTAIVSQRLRGKGRNLYDVYLRALKD